MTVYTKYLADKNSAPHKEAIFGKPESFKEFNAELTLIEQNANNIIKIDRSLLTNKKFIIECVKINPFILYDIAELANPIIEAYFSDIEVFTPALKVCGKVLELADENIRNNLALVKQAIVSYPDAFQYAGPKLDDHAEHLEIFAAEAKEDIEILGKLLEIPYEERSAVILNEAKRNLTLLRYLMFLDIDLDIEPKKGLIASILKRALPESFINEFHQKKIELRKEHNLEFVYRFREWETLEHILNIRRAKASGTLDIQAKTAVYIFSKTDFNAAFEENQISDFIRRGYTVLCYEIASKKDLENILNSELTGVNVDTLVISGHGRPESIQLIPDNSTDIGSKVYATFANVIPLLIKEAKNNFTERNNELTPQKIIKIKIRNGLSPKNIILDSCSAKGTNKKGKNIAEAISEVFPDSRVYAAEEDIYRSEILFDDDNNVFGFEYSAEPD